jgi:phosphoserine phosphatase RsbU/P
MENRRANPKLLARYVVLILIGIAALLYEARLLKDILTTRPVDIPFFTMETASARINNVRADAAAVGLRRGDTLLEVNGRPYSGTLVLEQERRRVREGDTLTLKVRHENASGSGEQLIHLPVKPAPRGVTPRSLDLLLHVAIPVFCLLLGLWVAIARPWDPLAWILLILLLGFPHIMQVQGIETWGAGVRELAMSYHVLLLSSWPIAMFYFGKLFPEPFPAQSGWRIVWKVLFWVGVVPLAILGILQAFVSAVEITNYSAMAGLYRWIAPLETFLEIMAYAVTGSFFAAIFTKAYQSLSADAARRLRLLYWGTTIAMTPALIITVVAQFKGKVLSDVFPAWLIVVVLALLALFPLTLAYVIVVQRAMDVRVVIRQGLQYAFAKNGIRVLQAIAASAVAIAAFSLARQTSSNRAQQIAALATGVIAVFTIRRIGDKLRAWTDRRFFREAYNAEQVLIELSDQVRTMVEPRPLLETVATRISETLHVPNIAVLLSTSEMYTPAYALGYASSPEVVFPPTTATVKHLRENKEPARVYLDDPDSWVYKATQGNDEERNRLAKLQSELLLPLAVRDKLLGFISLGPKRSEEPYSGSDVRLLKSVAAQTGLALENGNLMRAIADEVAQRERLNREVEIAREVQERLFPQKLPSIRGLDYAGHCRPALGVGGDYYDFLGLPEGHLGVAIGDVSGKGIAAALMMASLQASLRSEATRAPENLAAAISNVNKLVYEASAANRYATFFYGQYDPSKREFNYVNAGHNPPMLFHCADGSWQLSRLEVGGTVVGLLESFPYQEAEVKIAPGDILVCFTDGISEAMNGSDQEWGEERLIETVKHCAGLSATGILQQIFQSADAFVAGAKQHDDMTLVVIRALQETAS